jgi:hypothetical protein
MESAIVTSFETTRLPSRASYQYRLRGRAASTLFRKPLGRFTNSPLLRPGAE